MTVAEVFDAVQRDAMFYKPSSGGVTLSGGEPLLQPRFARALLEKCHEAGIHTCIETSGHAAESALREVLPHTDYVLYDLKLLDSERHRRYTGTSNSRILANARVVVESGVATLFRMPLIPGVNDDPQNIRDTAAFIRALGGDVAALQLMAYHRLAMGKYESLDRPYTLADLQAHQPDEVERVRQLYAENGVRCTVSQ
jgi:pyruvate formate lyase activating enzyme